MTDTSPSHANPAAEAFTAPPCVMVIFGAAGDLTRRLIVPALYHLTRARRLPEQFRLVGVDVVAQPIARWQEGLTAMLRQYVAGDSGAPGSAPFDEKAWGWLAARMSYLDGDLGSERTYRNLSDHLAAIDRSSGTRGNYLFYLAVADRFFGTAIAGLGHAGLTREQEAHWRRVVIEKPFGHDLGSARALNAEILKTLEESQVYRIDHFLGKETVQNLMVLRFANGIFEPIWNRLHIDHVQITAAETVGVEHRASFYERTGALRDMVPNHLFQLLAMTAMEPPTSFDPEAVRTKKAEVIQAIRPIEPADVSRSAVRGQYRAGPVAGNLEAAYRDEPGVASGSQVETYVACRFAIDNWRWAGVPFYLRTGKRLCQRRTEIAIRFDQAPYALFRGTDVHSMAPNWLIVRIQPDEGIALEFAAKRPGPTVSLGTVRMDFAYKDYFQAAPSTGYETLIYDCMIGDATLFQRAENIEAGWRAVQPILDTWAAAAPSDPVSFYTCGSSGPDSADELLARDGRSWRALA